jgi:hypothetical protein
MGEINKLETGGSGFYRTSKGQRAHRNMYCANTRRSIWSTVHEIPEAEIQLWTPCLHCCNAEERELYWRAAAATPAAPAKCANAGIKNPGRGRIYSECSTCGKHGKVNRSTGRIRAHLAAK